MKDSKVKIRYSLNKKLISLFVVILLFSTISVGITGYCIARNALKENGEIILKNHVRMALLIIESEYEKSQLGIITEEEAMENVKTTLMGEKKEDGIRTINDCMDLGECGYMVIYDCEGNEIMHPTLEGTNVWNVTDKGDPDHLIVQEQIAKALAGGGFSSYVWNLPYSDKMAKKTSYQSYDPNWRWVVVATAYKTDFNATTNMILMVLLLILLPITVFISWIVNRTIRIVTKPIIEVSEGMNSVIHGHYVSINEIKSHDEIGLLIRGYNKMVDAIDRATNKLEEKTKMLTYLAYNDDLTELSNRNRFKKYVSDRMLHCNTNAFLIQIDIHGFKMINSIIGYEQGDRCLKLIGAYCTNQLEEGQFIARTSGNEFSIWMENSDSETVIQMLMEMIDGFNHFLKDNDFHQNIDFHVAASIFPRHGTEFEALYSKTAMTMKHAKQNNNQKVFIFNESMENAITDELEMRKYLKEAINHHEISVLYQDKYDFLNNQVVGVEALARWRSEEIGIVAPSVFIQSIEQLNLAEKFGNYMIELVFSDYKALASHYGQELTVSINISPTHFLASGFVDSVIKALEKHDMPANRVILEVTENIFIADFDEIHKIIGRLHQLDIRIAIDDFGTGYSSFNYLKNIEFDELKIDKTFIDQIIEDEKSYKLLEILCNFADALGYDIVAEGVETTEQLEKIKNMPIRIVQGYLFSMPLPLETILNQ